MIDSALQAAFTTAATEAIFAINALDRVFESMGLYKALRNAEISERHDKAQRVWDSWSGKYS
jgi:hypothetical protein